MWRIRVLAAGYLYKEYEKLSAIANSTLPNSCNSSRSCPINGWQFCSCTSKPLNGFAQGKVHKFQQFAPQSGSAQCRATFNGKFKRYTRRRKQSETSEWVQARRLNGVQGGVVGVGVFCNIWCLEVYRLWYLPVPGWCYLSGNLLESNQSQPTTCAPATNDLQPRSRVISWI